MQFGRFGFGLVPQWLGRPGAGLLAAAILHLGCSAEARAQGQHPAVREAWRSFRDGPVPAYGAWGLLAVVGLLAAFYLLRGRIRIEHGWGGYALPRFTRLERAGHWLLAISFIVLALTGLCGLYGRQALLPLVGPDAFAVLSNTGRAVHAYVAFAFMFGLVPTFVLWVARSFPTLTDIIWLLRGGGVFSRGQRPPAWKFNAAQKVLFWLVMLGGLALSLSGLALLYPFQIAPFAKIFAVLNLIGLDLPANLTPTQELHYAARWHGTAALILTIAIVAHIYMRTLGTQGAFDAMASGEVDVNWAREHHSLWAEQELKKLEVRAAPAE